MRAGNGMMIEGEGEGEDFEFTNSGAGNEDDDYFDEVVGCL